MSGHKGTILIAVLLLGGPVLANPTADGNLTPEEQSLLEWGRDFQKSCQELCELITAPSRFEAEQKMGDMLNAMVEEGQGFVDQNLDGMDIIARYTDPDSVVIRDSSPDREREVTRRQMNLIRAWMKIQRRNSPRRTARDTCVRAQTLEEAVTNYRLGSLKREFQVAKAEQTYRRSIIKPLAKQYAANWLLRGHPEGYVPLKWRRILGTHGKVRLTSAVQRTYGAQAEEQFEHMRDLVKELTKQLVMVGIGERSPEYLVEVDREFNVDRFETQALLAAQTGHKLAGGRVRLASARSVQAEDASQ
jgi:hypothetical protein